MTPAIAFAVPVQGPVHVVAKAMTPAPPTVTGPVYQQITYGRGEGAQPPPEYPIESAVAGQTGTVVVRYRVAEDGKVTSTEIAKPCKWPLLNQAAARSIRETWSYPAGPVRYFEIKIIYQNKR
jgi:TonB family protein